MRYLAYLLASFVMQVVAWIVTPVLPLFAVRREGSMDNANSYGVGFRLPRWLAWFDTPDNPLEGDSNWFRNHPETTHNSTSSYTTRLNMPSIHFKMISMRLQFGNLAEVDPQFIKKCRSCPKRLVRIDCRRVIV